MQNGLYRKPGSLIYWVRYRDARGYPVEHCTGSANVEQAASYAAELVRPVTHSTDPAPNPAPKVTHTVDEALAHFIQFSRVDRSPATVECYEQKAGHLVRLLGECSIRHLHIDHVHAYVNRRLDEGAARESLRKELVVLRCALQLAKDRGVLDKDPAALIPRFRAPYKPRQRWLSTIELAGLLRHLDESRQRWVMLAVFTGARLSEIESLRWGDLDFERSTIHIRGTKTARSDRHIPLHPTLAELLHPLRSEGAEQVAGAWHNVRRDLALACRKAQIDPVTPNDLRRTFASWLKQAGRDSLAVGKLLGHTSSRMVERVYGQLDQRTLRETVAPLPTMQQVIAGFDPDTEQTSSSE